VRLLGREPLGCSSSGFLGLIVFFFFFRPHVPLIKRSEREGLASQPPTGGVLDPSITQDSGASSREFSTVRSPSVSQNQKKKDARLLEKRRNKKIPRPLAPPGSETGRGMPPKRKIGGQKGKDEIEEERCPIKKKRKPNAGQFGSQGARPWEIREDAETRFRILAGG